MLNASKKGNDNKGHMEMFGGDGRVWPLAWGCACVHAHQYACVQCVHFFVYQFF